MKRPLYIFLCILLSSFVIAFGRGKQTPSISEHDKALADYFYMEGVKQNALGNYASAYDLMNEAIRINPSLYAAKCDLGLFLYGLNAYNESHRLLQEASEGDTTNFWYNNYYAISAYVNKKYDIAEGTAKRNLRNHPQRYETYNLLAKIYIAQNKYNLAEQCYDSLENYQGLNSELINSRAVLYEAMGDTARTLAFYQELIEKNPGVPYYIVLLGNEYHKFNYDSLAMQMLEKAEQIDPNYVAIYPFKAEMHIQRGDTTAFTTELNKLIANPNIYHEVKKEIIDDFFEQLTYSDEKLKLFTPLYKSLLQVNPQEESVLQTYLSLLYYQENYQEIASELEHIIAIYPDSCKYRSMMMDILAQLDDYDQAIEVGYNAIENGCNDILYQLGVYLSHRERYDEAHNILTQAINNTDSTQTELQAHIYGAIANNYASVDIEKAIEFYEKSLALCDTISMTMNNYAYMLSNHKDADLTKAERLSAKTIQKEPDNITYLDTYAWILFRKNSFSLAQIYIERAISLMNNSEEDSATIYEHYGDILFKLGKTEDAVIQWEKAYRTDNKNLILKKKIELKEYIEE